MLEVRGAGSTIFLIVFSILVLTVLVVAFGPSPSSAATAAGTLWVALIFSGVLGASRVISTEREDGSIYGLLLSPIDSGLIFAAKFAAAFGFIVVAESATLLLLVLFLGLDFSSTLLPVAAILLLGVAGFAAVGTLLAAVSTRTRMGDLLLPLLVIPVSLPALIAGVRATVAILSGAPLESIAAWLRIIIARCTQWRVSAIASCSRSWAARS